MASTAGKANWNDSCSQRRKPRPVAKQLESPVDAAARGPKGTEVLKGPGGSLGSVRRNCVHGLHSWKGQLEWQANKQLQPSLVESLDQWPSSCGKPSGSCSEGPKGTEVLKGPGGSLGSVRRNCVQGFNSWKGHWDLQGEVRNWNERPLSSCSQGLEKQR